MVGTTRAPAEVSWVAAKGVRRWIRSRQIAANGRLDPGAVYSVLLAVAMAVALLHGPIVAAIWPGTPPDRPGLPPEVLAGVGLTWAALYSVLRRLGPLTVSRSAATWLLPAPVSRRMLLTPSLSLTTAASAVIGAVTGLAVLGHAATRPVPAGSVLTGASLGAAGVVAVALLALLSQRRPAVARRLDASGGAVVCGLLAVAAAGQLTDHTVRAIPPSAAPVLLAVALLALAAALAVVVTVWLRLDGWPTHQLAEASANAGAYADAAYAVEPSFLAEVSQRRFWQRRGGFRPSQMFRSGAVPPLVAHDLLTTRRKAGRFWWLAATAMVPVMLGRGPAWLQLGAVLIGAIGAASVPTESTHSEARSAALLRLLGLSGRRVVAQRLVVPSVLAALWCTAVMVALQAAGLVRGPWWALGLAAGPAVAVAAVQRAKASAASVANVLVDTPLGAFPAGMLLWLLNGLDVLTVLSLPLSVGLASHRTGEVLSWAWVVLQAFVSAAGCALMVRWSKTRFD